MKRNSFLVTIFYLSIFIVSFGKKVPIHGRVNDSHKSDSKIQSSSNTQQVNGSTTDWFRDLDYPPADNVYRLSITSSFHQELTKTIIVGCLIVMINVGKDNNQLQ